LSYEEIMQPTILVVEDEAVVRTEVTELLTTAGYTTMEATSGWAALDVLWQADALPQLILLDLMLPGMDGWQFRQMQQQDPDLAGIPVVLLGSAADEERSKTAMQGLAFLTKPIDAEQLLDAVARCCGQSRAR
jgi:CheY-like chemotaxis protein